MLVRHDKNRFDACVFFRRWGESDVEEVVEQMERIYAASMVSGDGGGWPDAEAQHAVGRLQDELTWERCLGNITAAIGAGAWRRRRLGP